MNQEDKSSLKYCFAGIFSYWMAGTLLIGTVRMISRTDTDFWNRVWWIYGSTAAFLGAVALGVFFIMLGAYYWSEMEFLYERENQRSQNRDL